MKINPTGSAGFIPANYKTGKVDAYKKSQGLPKQDEAALSEEAVSFSKAFVKAKEAANVRSSEELSHIAEIKERIASGTYRVDSDKLADSILNKLSNNRFFDNNEE